MSGRMLFECTKITNVVARDEVGVGNANHVYDIMENSKGDDVQPLGTVKFQKGPIKEDGINGVMNEDLLAILIDRLRGFQGGVYKCRENAIALTKIEEALMWLKKRTLEREYRGVEGTSTI